MKVIVLDLHGIIYTHTPDFDIDKSTLRWREELEKYKKRRAFRGLLIDGKIANDRLALRMEYDSLRVGLKDKTYLQFYFMPRALGRGKEIFDGRNKVIICSNALLGEERLLIDRFIKAIQSSHPISDVDFHNFKEYGDKKDPEAWYKIFSSYKKIDEVYEDGKVNIAAAREALHRCGFTRALCEQSL